VKSRDDAVALERDAVVTQGEIEQIVFGDEGQRWQMMDPQEFVDRPDAVPHMQVRLAYHGSF
jgi:hypothetical protein